MPVLIDHLERRLGHLTSGWRGANRSGLPTVNIGRFTGGVFADTTGYATMGLSRVPLHRVGHERHYFLEFIAAEHGSDDASQSSFPHALEYVWARCVDNREAVLRGEIITLASDLVVAGRFRHLYAALPVYYDDDFSSVVLDNGDAVAIVWLVPITADEADFVAARGWPEFEQVLIECNPDLMDMNREAVV